MDALNLSVLLSIIAGITVMTNIIVQVLKKITWDKIPTNLLALIIAEALTLASADERHCTDLVSGCRCNRCRVHGGLCRNVRL